MADKKQKGNLLTRSDHNYFLPFVIVITALAWRRCGCCSCRTAAS